MEDAPYCPMLVHAPHIHTMNAPPPPPVWDLPHRYRLLLRPADQQFLEANMLQGWLGTRYHLSPTLDRPARAAAAVETAHALAGDAHNASSSASSSGAATTKQVAIQQHPAQQAASQPLANEAWWRTYCSAAYIDRYLSNCAAHGMQLPDFLHHMLRNCYVVVSGCGGLEGGRGQGHGCVPLWLHLCAPGW